MPTNETAAEEVDRLRRTMRDLVALSTLPAVWAGHSVEGVVRSLAEVLSSTLSLDLVYIRVRDWTSFRDVEVARGKGLTADGDQVRSIADALAPWLKPGTAEPPQLVVNPLAGGELRVELRVAVARFGHTGDEGAVVACSRRPDFPTETDRLLLSVGTNQTAVVLQRNRAERSLAAERQQLRITLSSIGDAVIATDAEGRVTFMNGVAESLTGWGLSEAVGRPLPEIFRIIHERTRHPADNPALRALQEGTIVGLANHTVLVARDGTERPIDDSAAPIRDGKGIAVGAVLVFRDVTERQRGDETRARLAAIVESSEDAIVSKSLDGTILSWNSGAERVFGYAPTEAVGQPITLIIPPERQEEERGILARLRRGERIEHFETVRRTKDGRTVDISLSVSPIRNSEGQVVGASKVARDITARKSIERDLAEVQARLEATLAAGEVATWTWDIPADKVVADKNLAALFSVSAADAQGGPLEAYTQRIHEEDRPRARQMIDEAIESGRPYEAEYRVVQANGECRKVIARGKPEYGPDGRPLRMPGVMVDITERDRAEAEVVRLASESDRQRRVYETALSNSADFNYVFDLRGRFIFVNATLLNVWGRTLSEAVGKDFFELNYPPELAERFLREIQQVIETRNPLRDETPYTNSTGTREFEYILVPVIGSDGSVEAVAGSTRDITERKRAEEQLRDADRKKDEFIALLAHELRNPLAPIRNGLQVLKLSGQDDKTAAAEACSMMDRQLSHMVRLIDDLLDVSRINRSKMELRRARVALTDVVNAAVETARPAIDAEGHELTISLPQRPVVLDADLTRLAQVVSNLLTNSAKYTERGGRIWLSAERRAGKVVVTVRDTGIGIPAESLGNIFDMFSQVDRSVERATGGLGIGLALVKGLVEMHNGSVTATSPGEGQGSTFTVTLPVLAEQTGVAPPTTLNDLQAASGPRRRILVVDDNRDGATSLAMMLRLMGNDVRTAHDGVVAIEAAEQFLPELILMDVGMPRLNGLDATRQIREQPWGRDVTIIALTGWGQDGDREQSREAGCDGHLVKPVNLPDLVKILGDL